MNIVIKFHAFELVYAHFLISNSISLSFKLFHPCTILSHHQSCFQYEVVSEITVSLEPSILLHVYLTWEGKSSCIYSCRVLQLKQSYIWNQLRDLIKKENSVCVLTFSVNAEWGVVEIILLITSVKPFESSLKINFSWNPFACGSNVYELVCFSKLRVTNFQTTHLSGSFCSAKFKKLQRKFCFKCAKYYAVLLFQKVAGILTPAELVFNNISI